MVGFLISLITSGVLRTQGVSISNAEDWQVGDAFYYKRLPAQWNWVGTGITCGESWNLTLPQSSGIDTVSVLSPSSTPYGSGLPPNTVAWRRIRWKGNTPDTLYLYLVKSPSDNQLTRMVVKIPSVGTIVGNYSNTEKVITRPLSFLSNVSDISARSYNISISGVPLTFNGGCTFSGQASACGTLTVNGTPYSSVLKFFYSRNCMDSATVIGSTVYLYQTQNGYKFFQSGHKEPLVMLDTVKFSVPSYNISYTDSTFEVLESITGIENTTLFKKDLIIWQSGKKVYVLRDGKPQNIRSISLIDSRGRIIQPEDVSNNYNTIEIQLPYNLSPGIYVLMINEGISDESYFTRFFVFE